MHWYNYTVVRQMSVPGPAEYNLTNHMGKYYTGDIAGIHLHNKS